SIPLPVRSKRSTPSSSSTAVTWRETVPSVIASLSAARRIDRQRATPVTTPHFCPSIRSRRFAMCDFIFSPPVSTLRRITVRVRELERGFASYVVVVVRSYGLRHGGADPSVSELALARDGVARDPRIPRNHAPGAAQHAALYCMGYRTCPGLGAVLACRR